MRDVRDLKKSENQKICGKTSSCEECVDLQKYQCMWCGEGEGRCMHYPIKHIWPKTEDCKWTEARWGVCWLDFRALVIALGVIGSILFITFCCCLVRFCTCVKDLIHIICCCGCCNCGDWAASRRAKRSMRRLERELERQAKRQELMLKYGVQNAYGTNQYRQFENTAT